MALAILGKYPERKAIAPVLIKVAQDKLNRFRMVYNLLDGRALRLGIELPDDMYTKQLSWLKKGGKEDRFIYQLLTAAVIHERECMMLELFQQVVSDKDLADKYQIFLGSVNPYTGMLGHYLSEVVLRDKMAEMSLAEAKIYEGIALAPALH
ncbi:MAG: tRNA isopentenyl-2-thiomethyl-A-37 hydroxylase MiaE [Chitinophagales bacterium]|nr:tRNA isopentenyl-2-thiomethyl-A-37 hydroxylase MiaE [Chitinophagales bacterium]